MGGVPKGGPQRVGPPLPGFRVWVCWVWGSGVNVGLWGLGFLGSQKFGQNTITLNLAKVGLATVGQHTKTLKTGQSRFSQSRSSPLLAKINQRADKVGLAKVGDSRLFASAFMPERRGTDAGPGSEKTSFKLDFKRSGPEVGKRRSRLRTEIC